jgi:hypothetical protein
MQFVLVTLIGALGAACSDSGAGTAPESRQIAARLSDGGDKQVHEGGRHEDAEECEVEEHGEHRHHESRDVARRASERDGHGDADEEDDDDEQCAGAATAAIHGAKFLDANGNGLRDPGEVGAANWVIQLSGPVNRTTVTDAAGNYTFTALAAGTYKVCEVQQTGFRQTFPAAGAVCPGGFGYSIVLTSSQVVTGKDFGNGAGPT